MSIFILSLADPRATLEIVGGKGASLGKLASAGFAVPDGFHITTEAYREFVSANALQQEIMAALQEASPTAATTLDAASVRIGGWFDTAHLPAELGAAIRSAYTDLCNRSLQGRDDLPVAVRSSATAEDLPGASFAGQQETYLNIRGADAVLAAAKKCWASLWTARAIAYRAKNGIDQEAVALAVVVQEMVNADAAGVLFTANPVNGYRDEIVINAAWGLGEAIVGGLVTPDTIVVDKASGKVKVQEVAEKTLIIVPAGTGTEQRTLTDERRNKRVLSSSQVRGLARIGREIEALYGTPLDIEWCRAENQMFVVQARPITALPEAEPAAPTAWRLPNGAYAAARNNIVELMTEPLSPLFETLGLDAINASLHRFLNGSFGMQGIMPREIVLAVNHYAYNNGSVGAAGLGRMIFGAGKILRKMFTGAVERWTEAGWPRYRDVVEHWQAKNLPVLSSAELVEGARCLTEAAIDAYAALISGIIPAAWITEAMFTIAYDRVVKRAGDPPASTYLLGYLSAPIRADQSLYQLADWVRQHPALEEHLQRASVSEMTDVAHAPVDVPPALWGEWQQRLRQYLQNFGYALYDLDFAHPVAADDPGPVLEALKLYVRREGTNPYARQSQLAERREQAVQRMQQRLKGWRLQSFRHYLASAQKYAPLREDGLAEIGLAYPLIRRMLRELGGRFWQHGVIVQPDEIYWLTGREVLVTAQQLDAGRAPKSLAERVPSRKAECRAASRVTPPMMLPQMKLFGFDMMSLKDKRGRAARGSVIKGVGAGSGRATGSARVLHSANDFGQMKRGEVLVAPITTPAWTPLFAMACAVVTDVGGPLSHGSIVAREYGIPAVLGTGVATRSIQSGQTVTVDGDAGTVTVNGHSGSAS
jgi:pyruvate,water dikinase